MEGTRMVGRHGTRLRLAVSAVAMVAALAGCDAVQQAQDAGRGVDKARQCATLVADLAGVNLDLSPGSVARAAGSADDAARKLDERARDIDQADVRDAAETLANRLQRLSDTAANSTPAQRDQAVRDVTQAATRLASVCNVPLDQLVNTG
jgi:hypothetical protein